MKLHPEGLNKKVVSKTHTPTRKDLLSRWLLQSQFEQNSRTSTDKFQNKLIRHLTLEIKYFPKLTLQQSAGQQHFPCAPSESFTRELLQEITKNVLSKLVRPINLPLHNRYFNFNCFKKFREIPFPPPPSSPILGTSLTSEWSLTILLLRGLGLFNKRLEGTFGKLNPLSSLSQLLSLGVSENSNSLGQLEVVRVTWTFLLFSNLTEN